VGGGRPPRPGTHPFSCFAHPYPPQAVEDS
jgi:hypothetical protein